MQKSIRIHLTEKFKKENMMIFELVNQILPFMFSLKLTWLVLSF